MGIQSPTVPTSAVPKGERDHLFFINSSLSDLGNRCEDLSAAIALFDRSVREMNAARDAPGDEARLYFRWVHMAAREAAAAIYKYAEDLAMLNTNLGKCPTLLKLIDLSAKRAATKQFARSFPGVRWVRDTGQHGGSIYNSPEKIALHSMRGFLLANSITGRTLVTTYKKKQYELEISQASLKALEDVTRMIHAVFWPLDPFRQHFKGAPPAP